jgi:hypothetical protein
MRNARGGAFCPVPLLLHKRPHRRHGAPRPRSEAARAA